MLHLLLLSLLLLLTILLYKAITKNNDYWQKKNVTSIKPTFFLGNMAPLLLGKKSIGMFLRDIHLSYPGERFVGIYQNTSPCLVVRDFQLCKHILIEDFNYFTKRILTIDKREPMTYHILFNLVGEEWKSARKVFVSGMASSKLKLYIKNLIPLMSEMNAHLDTHGGGKLNIVDFFWKISTDTLCHLLFGLQTKALNDPDDQILKIISQFFKADFKSLIPKSLVFGSPKLYNLFKCNVFPTEAINFVDHMTWQIIKTREETGLKIQDLIGTLQEARKNNDGKIDWNGYGLTGQVLTSITASTDTWTSTAYHLLYELAKHQEIQDKVRNEMNQVLPEGIKNATYESALSLDYLRMVMTENLRLHPAFPFIDRKCTKTYTIPGTNVKLDPGVLLLIPTWGLHMDETYWDKPHEFNPERFRDHSVVKNKPFLAFSLGPRTCAGQRYTELTLRLVIGNLIQRYRWTLVDQELPQTHPYFYTLWVQKPIYLQFEPIVD